MKKLIILGACMAILLCGCGKKDTVDGIKVAEEVFAATLWQDEVTEMAPELLSATYGMEGTELSFKVWIGSGATAEELAIFDCADEAQAETALKAVNDRVVAQREGFADYIPTELPKLEKPLILQCGNAIFLVIADDTAAAEDIITKAYKN